MRHGLTLIELIFSMVIIAIVFTVVPKIIFASNKSLQLSVKEDALFNAVTLMGMITKLPWDENTRLTDGGILNAGSLTCKGTSSGGSGYRIGGFIGSRNCLNDDGSALWQNSPLGMEDVFYNDVDDYHGYGEDTSGGRITYHLTAEVNQSGDIKGITVRVSAQDATAIAKSGGTFASSFFYESANLGHVQINSRTW